MRIAVKLHAAACLAVLLLAGCKGRKPEPAQAAPPATPTVSDDAAVLAEIPARGPAGGSAVLPADSSAPDGIVFAEGGAGVAYVSGGHGSFQVVHNGRPGRPYPAVGPVVLSRDGRRCAHPALAEGKWRVVVDGAEGPGFAAVEAPSFSPDGAHVTYRARTGPSWYLVVDGAASDGSRARHPLVEFSGDSSRIVLVDEAEGEWGRLVVSDLAFQDRSVVDARVSSAILSPERSRVAAISERDGRQGIVTFAIDRPDRVTRGPAYDAVYGLVFAPDGVSLAYVAERGGERFVVLEGREERLGQRDEMVGFPVVRPGNTAVGAPVIQGEAVIFRQFLSSAKAERPYHTIEGLVYSADGRSHAYAAERDGRWLVVVNGKEGPAFDRVVSPTFSPDGTRLVYRARKAAKRFVVVADGEGGTIREHPGYDEVHPVRFTADGRSVAYGVKDGTRLAWKVERL